MTWRWSHEGGRFVLRPHPLPGGIRDAGFLGRGAPPDAAFRAAEVRLRQVHGAAVHRAVTPGPLPDGDALVTDRPELVLTVRTADCVPLLLVHPDSVLGLVHAGWRGLTAGVVEAAVAAMPSPARLDAWIGPSIGPCCFEVGEEVAAAFPAPSVRRGFRGGRPRVDLPGETARRLAGVGLDPGRIRRAPWCTRCHQHLLHSHRGSGGTAGRIIAYAALRGAGRAGQEA